jgi:hypothetical protein
MSVINRANGHEHIYYMIDPAVYTLRQAREKPLKLAADVERGLTWMLGADPGYGHLIAKNPLAPAGMWRVQIWHEVAWDLVKLVDSIPKKYLKRPKPRQVIGLGRNCAVFESTRHFAYRQWQHQRWEDYGRLFEAVYSFAMNVNAGFETPMQEREVRNITRSVSKWTARHLTRAGFIESQSRKGRKSGKVRGARAKERADEVKAFHAGHPQFTTRELAQLFDCSERSVYYYLEKV